MENYVHQISPIALHIYGNLAVRWYGLAYLAGLGLGLLLMKHMSKKGGNLLNQEQLTDLVTWSALGVMIGGRLGYCLFYSPDLFFDFSSQFPFWGVLKVWEGGMASHGGFMGVLVSSVLFARKYKMSWFHINDLTVLGGSLGFFFGRIANFINGELYGRVVEKPIAWGVKFPQEMTEWLGYSPKNLKKLEPLVDRFKDHKEVSESIRTQDWLELVERYSSHLETRQTIRSFVGWVQEQAMAKNQEILEALQGVLSSRYPSQLIQALCEGLLVFCILNLIWLKPRKPGILTAWFGILYGLARIFGEQFRMPDSPIGFQLWGLTRGQWLSVFTLLCGLLLLFWASQRKTDKVKGWSVLFHDSD